MARIGVPNRRRSRAGIVLRVGVATLSSAAVVAAAAGVSHAANSTKFDTLTVGTTYVPPTPGYATFVSDAVLAAVGSYHASTGAVFTNAAFVENLGKAFGAGGEIHLSNVEMKLGLIPTASTCVLKYGYYGGEVSLRINGSARVYGDVMALNGTTPGGAAISVSKTASGTGFYAGEISMSGSISNFAIGGQELWVDELLCAPPRRLPPRGGALPESGPTSSARRPGDGSSSPAPAAAPRPTRRRGAGEVQRYALVRQLRHRLLRSADAPRRSRRDHPDHLAGGLMGDPFTLTG